MARIVRRRLNEELARLRMGSLQAMVPLAGLAALIWFLLRVLPKPSRAGYPCQRVAAPIASSFLLWLLAIAGSGVAFRWARERWQRAKGPAAAVCVLAGMAGVLWAASASEAPAQAGYAPHPANAPIGIAQGLAPGRVVWIHDPDVTDWPGPGTSARWYDHVDQSVANNMVSHALRAYAGERTDRDAWEAIFRFASGGEGYEPGEKLAIKINLTTANARGGMADAAYNQLEKASVTHDSTANTPQLLHALLGQLVSEVGVDQQDITIGDPTGLFVNYLYEYLHDDYPHVLYWDNRGTLGRTAAQFGSVPIYWGSAAAAGSRQDYVPRAFEEADYIINLAVLKSHEGSGFTATAKNHYGSLLRCPDGYSRDAGNIGSPPYNGYYHLHYTLPVEGYRDRREMTGMGHYRALVDLMGHEEIGGKTLLYLVDGVFGGRNWNSAPERWSMAPFGNDWPSSLFLSMDPVAIDSVARDFLAQQWPDNVLAHEGVEDYLHEAAMADFPPSGTVYDPEGDGTALQSLGVHEHWDNAVDKRYSHNLGVGDGIALVGPALQPDLLLTKKVMPAAILAPGAPITFTLEIANQGLMAAADVVIEDRVPGVLISVEAQGSMPLTATGDVSYTWSAGTLPAGFLGVITVSAVVSPALEPVFVLTNTATVGTSTEEPDTGNNTGVVRVIVTVLDRKIYLPLVRRGGQAPRTVSFEDQ